MAYNSPYNLEALVVNTKAAAIYAANENSLFLGGSLIPFVNIPAGSMTAQVPLLSGGGVDEISTEGVTDDLTVNAVTDTSVTISAKLYGSRAVLRLLGGIDPVDLSTQLGKKVANAFDNDCVDAIEAATGTNAAIATGGSLSVANLFTAAKNIRAQGEMGQLFGVIGTDLAESLMTEIAGSNFAGGDYQNEAMRNGFVGRAAGINIFQSSYCAAGSGGIFSADAFRIAMFRNMDVTVSDRPEAVGQDIVASLHANVGLVDAARVQPFANA
jgi:hypothetical protein